jgi:uncharacterized phiE125 gp8 family phage protein
MALTLITPPATEPITVSNAKMQMRITTDMDDVLVESRIEPARAWAEHETGRQMITAMWELRLDAWPGGRVISLPKPPLQSVESIKYLDPDGVEQAFAPTNYTVDAVSMKGRIVRSQGVVWPALADVPGAVRIRFVAGYGDATNVPALAKSAILLRIQAEHLGDQDTHGGMMEAARRCLDSLRVVEVV